MLNLSQNQSIYLTHWQPKDENKEYPHGYGFSPPLVTFPSDADPAWVDEMCREHLSNDEFFCMGVIPKKVIDSSTFLYPKLK